MASPLRKRQAGERTWSSPQRGGPAAALGANNPIAIAPQTAGQELPPVGSYLLRARLSRGKARVDRVQVDCLKLKADGEDGATWIDSNGGVVATKASYRFMGSGSLALDVVPPSGKYRGGFVDPMKNRAYEKPKKRGETMSLIFTRTSVGACTVEGSCRNHCGPYKIRGRGTLNGVAWDLRLFRTLVEEEEYQALLVTERARLEAATRALAAAPDNAAFAAAHHQVLEAQAPPPPNPWLAGCAAPLELRRHVIDEDWRAALNFIQERYVDERHGVPAQRIYAGKFLRRCHMMRQGGGGRYTFGASSAGLAGRRAAVQGYSNLLSNLKSMEQTDAFKAAPKTIRRGARLARQGRWYDYKEGDVLDQCQLRVVPSFWGRVDGSPSSTPFGTTCHRERESDCNGSVDAG